MRYLVTGASGFIGWHLVDHLARDGGQVTAWMRTARALWPGVSADVAPVDVTDARAVADALSSANPDIVFHLAAQSLPARSWAAPNETMRVNLGGTLNLLEAARAFKARPLRLLIAGSSSQYGPSRDGQPIAEDAPVGPASPYAVSKLAADQCAELYARAYELDVVRFRPFFWIGPRKTGDVTSDLARRIVAIERGSVPRLEVGRTDVVRDMIDVRDGLAGLLVLAARADKGEAYNICAGAGVSIAEIIDRFRALAHVEFEVVQVPELLRPLDERVRIGDPGRLNALGWRPARLLSDTLANILQYWRSQPSLQK